MSPNSYQRVPIVTRYWGDKSGDKIGDSVRMYPGNRASVKPGAFQSDDPQRALAPLLPNRRLGLQFAIALPESFIETNEALSALAQFLPFDEAEDYQEHLRFLDRLARWLRLI